MVIRERLRHENRQVEETKIRTQSPASDVPSHGNGILLPSNDRAQLEIAPFYRDLARRAATADSVPLVEATQKFVHNSHIFHSNC